ncbi:MAG: NTP transferase domain-containing protein, partial [Nitrososphaerota archaeon]|nr:NTP transferase domain-containing protein [Nitrososphaerota archaeon]
MQAAILAGGLGTRLRPLTDRMPKAMAPVNGRPFLEYELELLAPSHREYWYEHLPPSLNGPLYVLHELYLRVAPVRGYVPRAAVCALHEESVYPWIPC